MTATWKGCYRLRCTDSYKALRMGPGTGNHSISVHCHCWHVGACGWEVLEALVAPTWTHVSSSPGVSPITPSSTRESAVRPCRCTAASWAWSSEAQLVWSSWPSPSSPTFPKSWGSDPPADISQTKETPPLLTPAPVLGTAWGFE